MTTSGNPYHVHLTSSRQNQVLSRVPAFVMWVQLLGIFVAVYVTQKIIAFRRAARSVGNVPGYRSLINRNNFLGVLLPRIPGLTLGPNWTFDDKHSVYAKNDCDILTLVGAFPCKPDIVLADGAAIKEVTTYRARFPKPVDLYVVLSFFGYNIVASEGEDWKRYRKISAPAFSERNNKLVWDETVALMNDLLDDVWKNQQEITFALFVISTAGFGHKLTWRGGSVVPPRHKMTFKDALYTVTSYIIPKILLPDWAMGLTKKTRHIALGFDELKMHMVEMVETRMKSEKVERDDLFSNLLDANSDEGGGLSIDELIAHTLCFTLALLALYPDEQEKLYQHIISVVPDGRTPTSHKLCADVRANAPPHPHHGVTIIPKRTAEDTTLTTTNSRGETIVVPIPEGTDVHINVPGLHYNPKYWADPHEFKPDRFLSNDWNKDAFIPFSGGPRACLGRKFAETEALACLTMLVSRYKVTVKEEPRYTNETFEQRKERLLKTEPVITLTVLHFSVTVKFGRLVSAAFKTLRQVESLGMLAAPKKRNPAKLKSLDLF
ncbi:hypothetical protein D9756_007134 [Leucocoprinus leucothites]|uniref:Cytochrome P450 n=1 Tax=Leucocoprinus leucothites TaxID=201217 RepID=A0A8H5D5E1_9AGAR|nr:hypothetical protein D9756_007134 [Leucoagaricus leucothites]